MKKLLSTFLLIVSVLIGYTQTYNMSNTSITTCSGTYYDENGAANYDGSDFTQTFTPATAGQVLRFVFTTWDIAEIDDVLTIYDVPTTASPIIGTYTLGTAPGTITATNATGQLTLDWVADNNSHGVGWIATISCIAPPGPCGSITNVTCGTNINYVSATSGSWNPPSTTCGYSTPGGEKIYAYTPTVSGTYNIVIVTTDNTYVDYFYQATNCSSTGWTCLDDKSSTGVVGSIAMTAGITYNILLDDENTTSSAHSFYIECPCSGTPLTPTISATVNPVNCTIMSSIISATGFSTGAGITYQWQSSTNGTTWTNMTGQTGTSVTVSPIGDTYYRIVTTCANGGASSYSSSLLINSNIVPPVNDEPCNATVLTVGTACTFVQSNNGCATASEILQPAIPAPGCASYSGGDIWFKVTVPASGRLIVDMDDVVVTDCGMAWYTGANCNNLTTLIECDDDDSQNGMMSMICRTGVLCTVPGDCAQNGTLTPGSTVWIRVWEYGNDVFGNLEICAYDPGDGGATSTCANATTVSSLPYANSATTCCKGNEYTSTDGCLSSYQDGEDYLYKYTPSTNIVIDISLSGTASFTGIFVTDKCPNAGGVSCIGSATSSTGNPSLCGVSLTAGTTYYIMIDTDPTPNCTPFSITIRESLSPSCGLNYTISDISYSWTNTSVANGGTEVVLPIDDRYSDYIPIGFNFCYDGIEYTRLLISSNAYVIFDAVSCATNQATSNATPGGSSDWSIDATVPCSTDGPRNCIMFPWMDTDPNDGGTITYKLTGTAPNRVLVISYEDVAYFDETDCPTQLLTSQVKLFETTNNIEIHIKNRDLCTNWNEGAGVVGLHNYNGTIAKIPTGYNYGTNWTASNKAWRFTCNCVGCISPLPIELKSFNYECSSDLITFKWTTLTETNNDYFTLEESSDAINFRKIAVIEGAGNSNNPIAYTYEHFQNKDYYYYRLKQTDFDGASETFKTIYVNCDEDSEVVKLYPNPAFNGDDINIKGKYEEVVVENILGIECFPVITNGKIIGLEPGAYIVTVDKKYRIKLIVR